MTTQIDPRTDLATAPAQLNILANGGFEQWSYGTAFPTPPTASYIADRWKITYSTGGGGTTFTISQESSIVDVGLSLKLNMTAAGTGNLCVVAQDIDNWSNYAGKTVSLSVRVKSNVVGSIRALIYDGANNTMSSYHTGDNTWQTLTVTAALPLSTSRLLIKIGALDNGDAKNGITYIDSAMLVISSSPVNFVPDSTDIDKAKAGAVSDLQRNVPNLLVNGGMEVWQRGTTFTTPAPATKTADMWAVDYSGTVSGHTVVFSREAGVGNVEGRYSMKLDYQVKGLTSAARLYQGVGDAYGLVGKTLTVQVRVKTSVANGFRLILSDGANTYSTYHTGSGNWETLVASSTSASPGSRIVYLQAEAVGVYYIDSVNMVVGAQSLSYIPEEPAIELMRCQRWYELCLSQTVAIVPWTWASSQQFILPMLFKVTKTASPTVTLSNQVLSFYGRPTASGGPINDLVNWTIVGQSSTVNGFLVSGTRSGQYTTHDVANVSWDWKAEVT